MSAPEQRSGNWIPTLIWEPVNPKIAGNHFRFALTVLFVSSLNFSFGAADLWGRLLDLAELGERANTVEALHVLSLAYIGGAAALLLLVLRRLMDVQLVLDLATGFLFVGVISLFIAWSALPANRLALEVIVTAVVVFLLAGAALFSWSPRGMMAYYRQRKSYGDVSVAVILLGVVYALTVISVWTLWRA